MPVLYHVTARWTGFPGAPGYSNFYLGTTDPLAEGAQEAADAVAEFFDSIKAFFSNTIVIRVLTEVETIDDATGDLVDTIPVVPSISSTTGTSASGFSGPTGFLINWKTAAVVGGRRLRGKTFLVPGAFNQFEADGTITAGALTILNNAANAYRTHVGIAPVVWHRPVGGAGGSSAPITSASAPDKAVVLRSRRD